MDVFDLILTQPFCEARQAFCESRDCVTQLQDQVLEYREDWPACVRDVAVHGLAQVRPAPFCVVHGGETSQLHGRADSWNSFVGLKVELMRAGVH